MQPEKNDHTKMFEKNRFQLTSLHPVREIYLCTFYVRASLSFIEQESTSRTKINELRLYSPLMLVGKHNVHVCTVKACRHRSAFRPSTLHGTEGIYICPSRVGPRLEEYMKPLGKNRWDLLCFGDNAWHKILTSCCRRRLSAEVERTGVINSI